MSNLFQTCLFGYSKKSVNKYLSDRSEEFSQRMLKKEQEYKRELDALQSEVKHLTEENERLRALRQEVADALISAKDYAADLKRQAEADNQARRAINGARQKAEGQRIQQVAEHIASLHQAFRAALERMDRELTDYSEELRRLEMDTAAQPDAIEQTRIQKEGEPWHKEDGQAS